MQSAGLPREPKRPPQNDRAHGCPGGDGVHFWAAQQLYITRAPTEIPPTNAVDATARTTVLLMVLVQGGGRGSGRDSKQEAARLPRGEGLRRRPVEGLLQEAAHELEVVDRDAVQRRRVIGRARRRVVGRVRVGHGHGGRGRAGRGEGRGRGRPRRKGPPRRLVDRRKRFHCWESRIG